MARAQGSKMGADSEIERSTQCGPMRPERLRLISSLFDEYIEMYAARDDHLTAHFRPPPGAAEDRTPGGGRYRPGRRRSP